MEGLQVYVANGNIAPSTFVKIDGSLTTPNQGNMVITAGSGDSPIGVAQKGTRYTPLPNAAGQATLDNGFAAIQNQDIGVYLLGASAPMLLGGSCNAGDWLKPNTNGDGSAIATSTPGDHVGGRATMAGIAGQIIDMQVQPGTL
jgi:hypothetical protein